LAAVELSTRNRFSGKKKKFSKDFLHPTNPPWPSNCHVILQYSWKLSYFIQCIIMVSSITWQLSTALVKSTTVDS